jgi:hypothetical protein
MVADIGNLFFNTNGSKKSPKRKIFFFRNALVAAAVKKYKNKRNYL